MRETALRSIHESLGARLVPFAGWSMPVQYASIVTEHTATRTAAGLFDISHMGRLRFDGAGAAAASVDWIWVDRHDPANDKAIPDLSRLPAIAEHGL